MLFEKVWKKSLWNTIVFKAIFLFLGHVLLLWKEKADCKTLSDIEF